MTDTTDALAGLADDALAELTSVRPTDDAVAAVAAEVGAPYDNELVRRLERNRLELYLKVLDLQDELHPPARVKPAAAARAQGASV